MNLKISSFADAGNLDKERIVLNVLEDVDIGRFVLMRSRTNDGGDPISGTKDAYWFPDKGVKKGDLVVVYTKAGKPSTKAMASGNTAHFYYWQKKSAFWGPESGNVAVLLEAPVWTSKKPSVKNEQE
jgi:hypothetical protein